MMKKTLLIGLSFFLFAGGIFLVGVYGWFLSAALQWRLAYGLNATWSEWQPALTCVPYIAVGLTLIGVSVWVAARARRGQR
jgi:hypothetical protein